MRYRVLGQLEVRREQSALDLGSYKQRALLALLLVHRNQVISSDRIIDEIWGDASESDRKNALHVYLSNLRKVLEPDRTSRGAGTVLLTRSPGYMLKTDRDEVDSDRFESAMAEARGLINSDPGSASIALGEALALWRGLPYEEFTYESFAQGEIARLNELRIEAIETRVDADLARGLSRELVGELEALVREYPLRERLAGQLMIALYRSGRQAEALRAYTSLKGRLADELGIDPSRELQSLEEKILLGDQSLLVSESAALPGDGGPPALAVRGYELRERIGSGVIGTSYRAFQPSVGREVAVKVVQPEVADDPQFIRSFEDEAQLIARLDHPNIVPVYDYWREPGAGYLVSRLMQGGSLANALARGPLERSRLAEMVTRIADALDTAHRVGVVHGDIKPVNVLLDSEGNAYLSGFTFLPSSFGQGEGGANRSDSGYVAPEVRAGGVPTRASDIFSLGALAAAAFTGRTENPGDLLVGMDPSVAEVVLTATSIAPEHRHDSATAFAAELANALELTEEPTSRRTEVRNPYKGLRAFHTADARDFFGRERLVERLLARLGNSGRLGRFVALVGPSGSGKSSAVRAGLLPALRRDGIPGSSNWYQIELTPGQHPFSSLEEALLGVAVNPSPSLLDELVLDGGMQRAANRVLPDPDAQLIVVIDQFEELFTLTDSGTANRFLESVVSTVQSNHGRIRFVLTLRADFYDRPLAHAEFGELLRQGTEVVTPMTAQEIEQAITGPARAVGVEFESAVVAEIINDVARRPGSLPLLQYALTELFERRRGTTITTSDYAAIAGVAGALGDRAEALYNSIDPPARPAVREVFLRLVTLGEGNEDTRRRLLWSELTSLGNTGRYVDSIVTTFGRHRLLSFDRDPVSRSPTVEISHEALLTEWPRLRRWIDEARADVRAERRLATAAAEWSERDDDDGYLFTGSRLARYEGWLQSPPLAITADERRFLQASQDKERDLEEEERIHAEERERLRRRGRLLVGLGVVTLVVVALAAFAFYERQRSTALAEQFAVVEDARRLVGESLKQLSVDPELALLLAIESARVTADDGFVIPETMDAVHSAMNAIPLQYPVSSDTPFAVRGLGTGPGGVFLMPPDDLLGFAVDATDRSFSPEECAAFFDGGACPAAGEPVPQGLEIQGSYEPAVGEQRFAGTRVVVLAPFTAATPEADGLKAEFQDVSDQLGMDIDVIPPPNGFDIVGALVSASEADLVLLPQPGSVRDLLSDGSLMDLSTSLDSSELMDAYGQYLMDLVRVGPDGTWPSSTGPIGAVWMKVDSKSVIWHSNHPTHRSMFDEPPRTWDDLMTLSEDLVVAGETPWCTGVANPAVSGWPATDTVENLVLKTQGPEFYDRWVGHEIPFDHPAVVSAVRRMTNLVYTEGFVTPGPSIAASRPWWEAALSLILDPAPACWMVHLHSFMPALDEDLVPGETIDLFDFPVVDPDFETASVGGGVMLAQVKDRPEVRAVLESVVSEDFGTNLAIQGSWIMPHRRFDLDNYPNPIDRRIAASIRASLEDGTLRFDGSDMMPSPDIALEAFPNGMVEILRDGPETIEAVLAEIEQQWVELEEQAVGD